MKKTKRSKLDSFFNISKYKSSVKTEIFAGLATFLAMAYILTVNPNNILWGGTSDPRFASVFIATALGAIIGTLLMAFLAKMPLAQAPGMGLNAMVGSIIGGAMGFTFSYGNAMALVLVSGIIFLLLSLLLKTIYVSIISRLIFECFFILLSSIQFVFELNARWRSAFN